MSDGNDAKPADGQCAFFLPQKRRFCRFRPNQGQKYCPEHACVLGVELERKRILCPLNPKHTCYEDSLNKHLKKCNSRKRKTENYYEEGINTGTDDGDTVLDTQAAVKATDTIRLKKMIERVNQLYEEHIGRVDVDIQSHECLREEMDNPYYGLSALRHRRQQASLIGQLDSLGLLAPGHCYVEMGAGKGQLSHWVRKAVSCHDDAAFLLVDRSSIRYKVDGYHKEEETVKFERIKVDIEHLNLGKVPLVANSARPLVAIGKHLCGAATDLTLRCLMKTVGSKSADSSTTEPSVKRTRRTDDTEKSAECLDAAASQSLPENSVASKHEGESPGTESGDATGTAGRESERQETVCGVSSSRAEGASVSADGENTQTSKCETRHVSLTPKSSTVEGANAPTSNRVLGVLIALCCHHQCKWQAYVGKEFMRQCGITAADFSLLTRLTSWAVCGWRDRDGSFGTKKSSPSATKEVRGDAATSRSAEQSDLADGATSVVEEMEHNTEDLVDDANQPGGLQLTEKQKEMVGWRCKRLIDYGRVRYLQDCGLHSDLKIYIDSQQTPENVVLIATPSDKS